MKYTTLNKIRACGPCRSGWAKLLKHLGKTEADDASLPFSVIIESNGLDDALWCCRSASEFDREWRLYAVWCARQVQHLMTDPRSIAAIDIAERHANGLATDAELSAVREAQEAAWEASRAARASAWAARAALEAARAAAAAEAAPEAARAAAEAEAWAAAEGAARAARAARAAAWAAAREAQKGKFLEVVG